jgi:serine phosphatase RsbU (regulator of sigma subunit)
LAGLLDAGSDAVVVYDREFRFVYLNAEAERLTRSSRHDLAGKVLWDVFPEQADPFGEPLTRAMRERVPVTFEVESLPSGSWTEGRCLPLSPMPVEEGSAGAGDAALTPALAVFFRDVTDRHAAARAHKEAEAARDRISYLAEVSAILSSSLDYQATLESMARVVVPDLCDWCSVQMPSADGTLLEQVAVAHADPEKVRWARELNRRYPTRIEDPHGIAQVHRTGEAVFMPEVPEEALAAGAKDEEHLRIILGLGFRSAIAVPLIARGRTLGVMLLVTTAESERQLSENDFTFAQELAARAAVAVDNARLFHEAQEAEREVRQILEREHRIAERLQEALQPSLPGKLPGLDMDAHYQPALQEANIGGDFYDVFAIEKGCFALVVADLAGKGLAAASQVATVRHMLRALLYQRQTSIADAVTRLNTMLTEHDLLTGFATLFVGAYDVNQRTLTYVNAGQEPGLILRKATSEVEQLHATGAVLGGFGEAAFVQQVTPLASGDVLALFTDGLTEAGPSRKDLLEVHGVTSIFRDSTRDASSAGQIKARMMQGVEAVATPAGIRDDVCLLIACVE